MWRPDETYQKSEQAPEIKAAENRKEKINFENNKRPEYRYYSHGTFIEPSYNEIKGSEFKFNEYLPDLTLSPTYTFKYIKDEIRKGLRQIKSRSKHLDPDKKGDFKPEHLTEDNYVLLVIEPTEEYKIHTTNEGMPNVFSTSDQKPPDDKTIMTRLWTSNQKVIFKKPISQRFNDGVKRPGMYLNRRMSRNGKWIRVDKNEEEDKEDKNKYGVTEIPGQFPVSSVKMAIKKDPEFFKIFESLKKEMEQGNKVNLGVYKGRLTDYFKDSKNIIRNEFKDEAGLAELAENMVVGEYEHSLVSAMRRLYLEIQRFKGKKVMHPDPEKNEKERKPMAKDEIMDKIKRVETLNPDNEVFKRYIEIYTKALKKELNS